MLAFVLLVAAKSPLGDVPIPADNPQSAAKIKLGNELFFDPRLSADGSRACYSCHQNEDGTGGHDPIAIGAKEKKLTRHSPIMWNVGLLKRWYWDGRSETLEAQGKAAWAGGNMGVGADNLAAKTKELEPAYKKKFEEAFPGEGMTPETIVKALAAYERTLVCDDTAYDKFAAGKKSALSKQQQEGLALFNGKAGCAACHAAPFFSLAYEQADNVYHNVIGGNDDGRMAVTKKEADRGAFKVPTLRNVSKSPPYFHDGSVQSLAEAVRIMASGGAPENKNRSPALSDRQLSETEIAALVSFLTALECPGRLKKPG